MNFAVPEKIANFLIKGSIFMLPLFFLPPLSASGMDNPGKQLFFWVVMPLAGFLMVWRMASAGEIRIKRSFLDIPAIIFLALSGLAVFGSLDPLTSFFGAFNNFNLPYLGVLLGVLSYFIFFNFIRGKEDIIAIIRLLIIAYALVLLAALALMAGSWTGLLPGTSPLFFYFRAGAGLLEDLAVYIAVMDVLVFASFYGGPASASLFNKKWEPLGVKILSVLSLWFLAQINFSPAWWCLGLGVGFTAVARYFWTKFRPVKGVKSAFRSKYELLWPALFIAVPLFFLLAGYSDLSDPQTSYREGRLDFGNTAVVSWSAIKNRPFFGYGSEMFSAAISLFRPAELNDAVGWDTRYKTGSSHFFVLAATSGLPVFASYLAIIIAWFYYIIVRGYKLMSPKEDNNDGAWIFFALTAAGLALLAGQLLYAANTVLWLFFWIFLALASAFMPAEKSVKYSLKPGRAVLFIFICVIFLLFLGWTALLGKYGQYFLADRNFNRAALAADRDETSENYLFSADRLNPRNYSYKISLSKFYLSAALGEALKPVGERSAEAVRDNFNRSIGWAEKARAATPYAVAVYENLGVVYRDIGVYSPASYDLSIKAFEEAARLEPTNPVIQSELGHIYLAQGLFDDAISAYGRAEDLKKDFFPARLGMARTHAARGDYDQALALFSELEGGPDDVSVFFEEGRIYFNQGNIDEAIKKFRQAIELEPLYANGLYALALALEKGGAFDEARFYYSMVGKLNPGNAEIKKKIEELEK
ncbi:MAG: tetratricopeptide repeat protein [Candidatus Falkowbacteria bacterium]